MSGLPKELYKECRDVLLKCEVFTDFQYLRSFCEVIKELNVVSNKLKEANTPRFLVMLNLTTLIETRHQEYGCIFIIFLENLRDEYYEEDEMWHRINNLWDKVRIELENPFLGNNNNSQLFQSIIDIDFSEQEDTVREAIKWQELHKRTGAFLIHGYDENFGQKALLTRLLRKLPELINGRKIQRDLTGMSDISELWGKISSEFFGSNTTNGQVINAILQCLETQNLIFIFSRLHRTFTGFLPDLIEKFWWPIVEKATHQKTYLLMFLVDDKGIVCKSGVSLAWKFESSKYPKDPLCLPETGKFSYNQLETWKNNVVQNNMVPESISVDELLQKSQAGVPELVYRQICDYCGLSWEGGLAKWLIQ
jgi:hypothetical protein